MQLLFIYLNQGLIVLSEMKNLIKNGVGNRPVDTVAAGPDIVRMSGANSCPRLIVGKMR
jgi:hypothetical protein